MSMQKLTHFNPKWLKLPEYSNWLIPVDDSNSAGCKQCNSTFSLSNMGKRALNSHMEGKKHTDHVSVQPQINKSTLLTSWIGLSTHQQPSESTSSKPSIPLASQESVVSPKISESPKTMQSYIDNKESVTKAEILWTINVVT